MPGKPNIVALQKARIELNKALQQLSADTKNLEAKMRSADPGMADAIKKTRQGLKELNSHLVTALDDALTEKDPAKVNAAYKQATEAFKGVARHFVSDPALKAIQTNALGVKVPGVEALRKALSTLGHTLA